MVECLPWLFNDEVLYCRIPPCASDDYRKLTRAAWKMSRRTVLPIRNHLHPARVHVSSTTAILFRKPLREVLHSLRQPIPAQARTISNDKYGRSLGDNYRQGHKAADEETGKLMLPSDTVYKCMAFGFSPLETEVVWRVLCHRAHRSRTPLDSYEWLSHYKQWTTDPATIPSAKRKREQDFISYLQPRMDQAGLTWNQQGEHDPDDMARALNTVGFDQATAAFETQRQGRDLPKIRLLRALYVLEIAVAYKNLESAVWLLKLRADPEVAKLGVYPNTTEAQELVYKTAQHDPLECPWQAMSVYMEDAYRLSELRKCTPNQRAWALEVLQDAGSKILPGNEAESLHSWQLFANPWAILLSIVNSCLELSLPVYQYSQAELEALRLVCLCELTEYNEPAACFDIATREKKFGSEDWVRLMTCAAADAQPDACWLLAIHYWLEDQLLVVDKIKADVTSMTEERRRRTLLSPGFECAEFALFSEQDRPNVLINRAVASAAILRTFGSPKSGGDLLQKVVDYTKDLKWFPPERLRYFENVLRDYNSEEYSDRLWSLEQRLSLIAKITDTRPEATKAMGIAAKHLPQPPHP